MRFTFTLANRNEFLGFKCYYSLVSADVNLLNVLWQATCKYGAKLLLPPTRNAFITRPALRIAHSGIESYLVYLALTPSRRNVQTRHCGCGTAFIISA